MEFLSVLSSLGPSVILPIIITIFGLCLRQGLSRSLRSGITIGIGFIGINIVVSFLFGTI
jgi:PTS system galactitol-specific IIC component